jgi:hypothetical protein
MAIQLLDEQLSLQDQHMLDAHALESLMMSLSPK